MSLSHDTTTFALVSAAFWANLPDAWITLAGRLGAGAALALVSGFAYAAGKWGWDRLVSNKKKKPRAPSLSDVDVTMGDDE